MSGLSDREKAFENKYARDAEVVFLITARRNKLVGLWAAAKMGMSEEDANAYAASVVEADFEEAGDEDVIRKLVADLTAADAGIDEATVRDVLAEQMTVAKVQYMDEAQ